MSDTMKKCPLISSFVNVTRDGASTLSPAVAQCLGTSCQFWLVNEEDHSGICKISLCCEMIIGTIGQWAQMMAQQMTEEDETEEDDMHVEVKFPQTSTTPVINDTVIDDKVIVSETVPNPTPTTSPTITIGNENNG